MQRRDPIGACSVVRSIPGKQRHSLAKGTTVMSPRGKHSNTLLITKVDGGKQPLVPRFVADSISRSEWFLIPTQHAGMTNLGKIHLVASCGVNEFPFVLRPSKHRCLV